MPMTPAARQLLRDVAAVIIESGYAVKPPKYHEQRRWQIEAIAQDERLSCRANSAKNLALINDVMVRYGVKRGMAKDLMCKARKVARARQH